MLSKNLDKKYTNRKSELNFPKKANKEMEENALPTTCGLPSVLLRSNAEGNPLGRNL